MTQHLVDPLDLAPANPIGVGLKRQIHWVMSQAASPILMSKLAFTDGVTILSNLSIPIALGQVEKQILISGTEIGISKATVMIGREAMMPFYLSLEMGVIKREDINKLFPIIRALLYNHFKIIVDHITIIGRPDLGVYDLIPLQKRQLDNDLAYEIATEPLRPSEYTFRLQLQMEKTDTNHDYIPIYVTECRKCEILQLIRLERYAGLELITGDLFRDLLGVPFDSLIWVALNDTRYRITDLLVQGGLPLRPINAGGPDSSERMQELILEIAQLRENSFSVCVSLQNLSDLVIIRELAQSFHLQELKAVDNDETAFCVFLQNSSNLERCSAGLLNIAPAHSTGMSSDRRPGVLQVNHNYQESWFHDALYHIQRGDPPLLQTGEFWIDKLETTLVNQLLIYYLAYQLIPLGQFIRVLSDLTLTFPCFSHEEHEEYVTLLAAQVEAQIYYKAFLKLSDAIEARWKLDLGIVISVAGEHFLASDQPIPDTKLVIGNRGNILQQILDRLAQRGRPTQADSLEQLLEILPPADQLIVRGVTKEEDPILLDGQIIITNDEDGLAVFANFLDQTFELLVDRENRDEAMIRYLVEPRWRSGWFLTPWARYIFRTSGRLPPTPIRRETLRMPLDPVVFLSTSSLSP
jgi:hypothetical protein